MQTVPAEFNTAIKRGYAIEGKSLVVAEWNYNNLFNVTVTNPPNDQNWILNKDYFTTASVASGFRPASGIFYGITDDSRTNGSNTGIDANRYYTIDTVNKFKYWVCPTPSAVNPEQVFADSFENAVGYPVDRGTLLLDYGQFLNMNKVSVTFNLGPMPVDWSIFVFEQVSNNWIEILNPTIDPITGIAEVWWNGTAWGQVQQLNENVFQKISQVKMVVRKLDAPEKRLQVVEVAGKREVDLTARTEGYKINSSMDNQDFMYPVGRMSADDGTITFDNSDLKMDHQDPSSDFYGALVGWCRYRTYVRYDLSPYGGTSDYVVRTSTMFANDFQQVNEYQYDVQLFDIFKILQSVDCPAMLIEDQSIARVVATLLDMVGVDTYSFDFADWDTTHSVKYFWTDGTEKVFDVFSRLCQSYQTALFVDEYGIIRMLTRDDITPIAGEVPAWTFRGAQQGLDLPDIIKLDKKYALQVNKLNIKYTNRQAKVDDLDVTEQPLTSTVWTAADPITLRASPLVRKLDSASTPGNDIWISSTLAETWPFKGKANIDGELIEYEGKGYVWWDHTTGAPVRNEATVKTNEERMALDRKTYKSYTGTEAPGGISSPTLQNGYNGRIVPTKRDADGSGQLKEHSVAQSPGWYAMDFWLRKSNSISFPGKYFTPGGGPYNLANLKDWVNKPGWKECQYRVTVQNSIATINNATVNNAPEHPTHATVLVKDHPDTEYREIGTRMRIRSGSTGIAMIPFYMTNATGYDNVNPPITEVFNATRCYVVYVATTAFIDSISRVHNEIWVDYKDGDNLKWVPPGSALFGGNGGNVKIDADKWYDIEIVFRDGSGEILEGGGSYGSRSAIEVYIDGAYVDTFYPEADQNIRPTSLIGVGALDTSIVDFEYLYGSTTTSKGRFKYTDDEMFDAHTLQLPAGTDVDYTLPFPIGNDWLGEGVVSFATWGSNATIKNLEFKRYNSSYKTKLTGASGLVLKPEQRLSFVLEDIMPDVGLLKIKYTATNPISVCYEYSRERNFPYGIDNEPVPPANAYYDMLKNGYFSTKADEIFFTPQRYLQNNRVASEVTTPVFLGYFYEDFGAIVHEVRDFNVVLDAPPAKGVSVYSSNQKAMVTDFTLNPMKGIFTMVNTSHRDEIINGTEQIDASNSIDQVLTLFGYVLESKGDAVETVQNDLSILRHGVITQDLDAPWIFTQTDAKALGKWITDHWGDSMDTYALETFCSTFIQIGDKVNFYYPNAKIDPSWMFIVTDKSMDMSSAGLTTSITVRRVR